MSTNPVSSHAEASPARADLSRRAILRGAPSVAALAVAAAVPAVAFARTGISPELTALRVQHAAARTAYDVVQERHSAAETVYFAEKARLTPAPLPKEKQDPEYVKLAKALCDCHDKSAIFREQYRLKDEWDAKSAAAVVEAERISGINQARYQQDVAVTRWINAQRKVVEFPATTLDEILEKARFIDGVPDIYSLNEAADALSALVIDIKVLIGGEERPPMEEQPDDDDGEDEDEGGANVQT